MTGPARQGVSLRDLYNHARYRLSAAGIEGGELDARVLVCAAAGIDHSGFIAHGADIAGPGVADRLNDYLDRRMRREPVSRILGVREFWSLEFEVSAATLDPRPDSETLIEAALEVVRGEGREREALRVLDLGTGTGCLLVALLTELPASSGIGIDASEAALKVAARNAERNGVAGRAGFICSDWMAALRGSFDLVISNPPYVCRADIAGLESEVREHDPVTALDGGTDGLDAYRSIAGPARALLREGGWIVLEIGAGQSRDVTKILLERWYFEGGDFGAVVSDLGGIERCVRMAV